MILSAIRETAGAGRLTGVAVRAVLKRRYGAVGGVDRLYELIAAYRAQERGRRPAAPRSPSPLPTLAEALERAALAEEREQIHQARWVRETEQLRARLQVAEQTAREVTELRLRIADLTRALATARRSS
jgi:hypothetical protein